MLALWRRPRDVTVLRQSCPPSVHHVKSRGWLEQKEPTLPVRHRAGAGLAAAAAATTAAAADAAAACGN
eukprot:14194761-Alexandrium_andersonii.AAC.1